MRLHLELREEQQAESGKEPGARPVLRRDDGLAIRRCCKEKSHMTWGWEWLESFTQDVGYGVRAMMRSPVLTAVALLSLALGIGANTAIFSLINAVMLRSLPVKEPVRNLCWFGDGTWKGSAMVFPSPSSTRILSIARCRRRIRSFRTSQRSSA